MSPAAALQGADGVAAQPGPLGQLLLRDSRGLPQPPQLLPEQGHPFTDHARALARVRSIRTPIGGE
jgi:hypothetical protein